MNKQNLALGLALVALIVATVSLYKPAQIVQQSSLGQITAISNFDKFSAGTTTNASAKLPYEIITDSVTATTTNFIGNQTAGVGGCIQLKTTDNKNIRIYASTTPATTLGTAGVSGLIVEAGVCE